MFLRALIIDANPVSRAYLWQATLAGVYFNRVKAYSHTADALRHLQSGYAYDVVLITSTIDREEVRNFISSAKLSEGGKEAAYVMVLKANHQDAENIAFSMMEGTDGFLMEPFSVDSLRQVAAIAARVKGEYERARQRAAIALIVGEIMKSLDDLANAKILGDDTSQQKKKLVASTRALKKLKSGNDLQLYYDLAPEMFEAGKPRPSLGYGGASKRVRERARKLSAKAAAKDAANGGLPTIGLVASGERRGAVEKVDEEKED